MTDEYMMNINIRYISNIWHFEAFNFLKVKASDSSGHLTKTMEGALGGRGWNRWLDPKSQTAF